MCTTRLISSFLAALAMETAKRLADELAQTQTTIEELVKDDNNSRHTAPEHVLGGYTTPADAPRSD